MAFREPSDAGRSRKASSGDDGELGVLALAPGWAPDADGFGSPVVEAPGPAPLGEAEVAHVATIAAIAIKDRVRWIMAACRRPETAVTPLVGQLDFAGES
jgi:hypothetical protein